jgi:GNAT superfamily N-acetyltransferase
MGFRHCDEPLVDYWSREQVTADLYHEISPDASCWIAMAGTKVIGFCWGYAAQTPELERKMKISFREQLPLVSHKPLAYQDEVGVLKEYRGKKIAKALVGYRLQDFLEQGLEIGVVRTRQTPEPSMTFLWYTEKLGYKILASYPDDDGRVILGRSLTGLAESFLEHHNNPAS